MILDSWFLASVVGGLLIAVAAASFLVLSGRILGVSGIAFGLLKPKAGDVSWRAAFVLGLVTAGGLARLIVPEVAAFEVPWPPAQLALAGLLVGAGARLGGGCTSGHGICGVGRLSRRSVVATPLFIAAGAVSVFVWRHVLGG